jgi:muconolactone delta-isomerase
MGFMVTIDIVIPDGAPERDAALALVPREKAHVAAQLERGVLAAYYLSADRTRSWAVMRVATQAAAEAELRQFPMFRFLRASYVALG